MQRNVKTNILYLLTPLPSPWTMSSTESCIYVLALLNWPLPTTWHIKANNLTFSNLTSPNFLFYVRPPASHENDSNENASHVTSLGRRNTKEQSVQSGIGWSFLVRTYYQIGVSQVSIPELFAVMYQRLGRSNDSHVAIRCWQLHA